MLATAPGADAPHRRPTVSLPSYSSLERLIANNIDERATLQRQKGTTNSYFGTWRGSFYSRDRGEYSHHRKFGSMGDSIMDKRCGLTVHNDSSENLTRMRKPSSTLAPWSSFNQRSRHSVYARPPARHSSYPCHDRHDWTGPSSLTSITREAMTSPEQKYPQSALTSPLGIQPRSEHISSEASSPGTLRDDSRDNSTQSSPQRSNAPQYPRRRGKLPKAVIDHLKTWLLEHADHPYPTEEEKRGFCEVTGLDISQVSNWFVNARRRILAPQQNAAKAEAVAAGN
ncbi:homeodomain super [Malassezia cuniculi]|uniref:Homeodomain super n=1 Tax=Malassezia cuniculi TaxID=948313 RepID=A0AAF0EV39_9BASI|nr:homeodomain super [Malassezia cuniculi]